MQISHNLFQMWDMELSKKLTQLRDKRGVSDREIARSLGTVSATTVGRWLSGKGEPSLSQALELAAYFSVPLTYLAYDDAEAAPSELPDDEASVLRVYRNLKQAGSLDEASAVHGLAIAASSSMLGRMPGSPTTIPDVEDLPPAGFEDLSGGSKSGRGIRRGKRSG